MRRAMLGLLVFTMACGPIFYQAPPSLGTYPERLPVKRWAHLFKETAPLDPALPAAAALDAQCHALPQLLARLNRDGRLAAIDSLLKQNRDGAYTVERANGLHELRELAADDAIFKTAESYISWRQQKPDWWPSREPAGNPQNGRDDEFAVQVDAYVRRMNKAFAEYDQKVANSPPGLMPNWMVQRGAFRFHAGRFADAAADFSEVIESVPQHPRAEVARLMLARCRLEQSRELAARKNTPGLPAQIQALREEAASMLQEFIHLYPNGRFTPDAHGWPAALAADDGWLGAAVAHQLDRLDSQPTREITGSVLRECDELFERLLLKHSNDAEFASHDDANEDSGLNPRVDFDAVKIATHPLVARLFVQRAIDPAAGVELPPYDDACTGGRNTIDFLRRRIFRPQAFIRLALRELARAMIKPGTAADATTLTLLAWSATEAGEHEQALGLLDQISDPSPSDDALQARAIVLQRLDRHAEALVAFARLATAYPDSPLVHDLPFRRAVSQFRSGALAKAIIGLQELVMKQQARRMQPVQAQALEEPLPEFHPEDQLIQWLDTLAQFSPLDELEAALAALPADALSDALLGRALAAHDFARAKRHLASAAKDADAQARFALFPQRMPIDAEAWAESVAPLENLYAQLAVETKPAAKAAVHLAIARHWLEHRGELTLPSLGLYCYANSEMHKQDMLRRHNALQLGFSREAIDAELDRRDEASQALEHALAAAASEDPAVGAVALELANFCLFRRAEFSLYQKSRALEANATKLSRELYSQLRRRFPQSPEAQRAVYHVFAPLAGPWMPGDYNSENSTCAIIDALDGRRASRYAEASPEEKAALAELAAVSARLELLPDSPTLDALRRGLAAARRDLDALRPLTDPTHQAGVLAVMNRIDDLTDAAALPDITVDDFKNYATHHPEKLPPAFNSLLGFGDRTDARDDLDLIENGPQPGIIESWQAFLRTYPDSPKAEAASFRLTRFIARQFRGRVSVEAFHFPDAPIPNGYKRIGVRRRNPDNEPQAVLAAIKAHEARFSGGRYQNDLNLLRAGALIDAGELAAALGLLHAILANPLQRDLHVVAALDFCELALRLPDPEQRMAVVTALRQTPAAMRWLRRLVAGDTCLARLEPLMPWLEAAVAAP